MQRRGEKILDGIEKIVPLGGATILEIGCGDGYYSAQLAQRCKKLISIDPDAGQIVHAQSLHIPHAAFQVGVGENILFPDGIFDAAIFSLSFHHIAASKQARALYEAMRVLRPHGHLIFIEPTERGTLYDAEIIFDAFDGDERVAKRQAQKEIASQRNFLQAFVATTEFVFSSTDDFIATARPKKNLDLAEAFLKKNDFILYAERSVRVFCQKNEMVMHDC